MCWSWQVSLIFSLFQWICIGYLVYRNKLLDRWCAAMQAFIATQETLQFCLWAWGIDENTDKYGCSATNVTFSYMIMFVVMGITVFFPFVWMYKSVDYKTANNCNCCCRKVSRYKIARTFFIICCIHYIMYVIIAIYHNVNGDDYHCTYVSENGHQKWAFLSVDKRHKIFAHGSTLLYVGLSLEGIFVFRPSWIFVPFGIYGFVSAIVAILSTLPPSAEWGSLWCWANSINVIFYVLTTPFLDYMIKKNKINKENSDIVYCGTFYGTYTLLEANKQKIDNLAATIQLGQVTNAETNAKTNVEKNAAINEAEEENKQDANEINLNVKENEQDMDDKYNFNEKYAYEKYKTKKWFKVRKRPIILLISIGCAVGIDLVFNGKWWITLLMYLFHFIFLIVSIYIEYKNWNTETHFKTVFKTYNTRIRRQWRITHVIKDGSYPGGKEKYYVNAPCYLLGVEDEYLLTQKTAWYIYIFLVCVGYVFMSFMIIHVKYNDDLSILKRCEYQSDIDENGIEFGVAEDYEDGNCFLTIEIPYVGWVICIFSLACVGLSYFDVTEKARNDLIKAKQIISEYTNKYNLDDSEYQKEYYKKIEERHFSKNKLNQTIWYILCVVIVFSVWAHLLFFELSNNKNWHFLSRIKTRRAFNYSLYFCSWFFSCWMTFGIIYVLVKTYNIYLDFYSIIRLLSRPIRIGRIEDLEKWWLVRRFYLQFVMPIYFKFGNGVYTSVLSLVMAFALYLFQWLLKPHAKEVLHPSRIIQSLFVSLCLIAAFLFTYTITSINSKQKKHTRMLLMEKARLLRSTMEKDVSEQNKNLKNNEVEIIAQYIDTLVQYVENYDIHTKALGVYVTKNKMYAFGLYFVSAILTLIIRSRM